ncbi:hypothetical protein LX36DRAFT_658858 [Colletotrichum falcatum]|nr:hypothetical protein LX36DRAFT_658858 [Colletotrichum falcatum]
MATDTACRPSAGLTAPPLLASAAAERCHKPRHGSRKAQKSGRMKLSQVVVWDWTVGVVPSVMGWAGVDETSRTTMLW